jgi:hypothetical protein
MGGLVQRSLECAGRWLVKAMTVPEVRAQAIVPEHNVDD